MMAARITASGGGSLMTAFEDAVQDTDAARLSVNASPVQHGIPSDSTLKSEPAGFNITPPGGAAGRVSSVAAGTVLLSTVLALFSAGCSASPANRAMTAVNAYHHYKQVYEERCIERTGPTSCPQAYAALRVLKARLEALNEAVQRGGDCPLQLDAVKAAEREVKRCLK